MLVVPGKCPPLSTAFEHLPPARLLIRRLRGFV